MTVISDDRPMLATRGKRARRLELNRKYKRHPQGAANHSGWWGAKKARRHWNRRDRFAVKAQLRAGVEQPHSDITYLSMHW